MPKDRYVVVAAGNIACSPEDPDFAGGQGTSKVCRMADTAELAGEQQPDAVLALGDLQAFTGTETEFTQSYRLAWGASPLRERTWPVPGPREYLTPGAAGFFATFPELRTRGEGKGYYSFDLGTWHLIALNGACDDPSVGGCGPSSPQGRWLAADLAAHPATCTLAFLSQPRFSADRPEPAVAPLWQQLAAHGVDLVLSSGGSHYERLAPLTADGALQPDGGVRSFLVGTGGVRLGTVSQGTAQTEALGASHGVLRLDLLAGRYTWRFLAVADVPLNDSGGDSCH